MNELLLHDIGARRVHWRYDDPSGVSDAPVRIAGRPIRSAGAFRVRRAATPKAA
jgi:hypothetical protein